MRILRLGRVKKLLDAREGAASGSDSCLNGFVGAVEIIPRERLDIGPQNQIRVALPYFELMLLGGADGAANDLENVGWSAAMPVFNADRNANYVRSAKFTCGARRDLGDETAIGEVARSDLHRFEQARESAASADCFAEISMSENDRLPIRQIRRDNRRRNPEIFKTLRFENLLDQVSEPVIAGEAEAGDSPPGDVSETQRAACGDDSGNWRAAGIGRPEDAADAGARDKGNGYVILFEYLQDADMGEAASETAAQREANTCLFGRGLSAAVQRRMIGTRHDKRMPAASLLPNGPGVLTKQYERTLC